MSLNTLSKFENFYRIITLGSKPRKGDTMNKLIAVFIIFSLSTCVSLPLIGELEQKAKAVTALVVTPSGYGTGVLVANNKVLTVNHVVTRDFAAITFYQGEPMYGEVIWRSSTIDLALLKIDPVDIKPIAITCELAEMGTPVFSVGQAARKVGWASRYGHVAASNVDPDGSLILAMHVSGGDSGSGVFNYQGELIGILETVQFSRRWGNGGFSFMIPSSLICEEIGDQL